MAKSFIVTRQFWKDVFVVAETEEQAIKIAIENNMYDDVALEGYNDIATEQEMNE